LATLCHVTELQKSRLPLAAQIHRPQPTVTPPASENTTVIVLPSDISPVPNTFGSQQNMSTSGKNLLLF